MVNVNIKNPEKKPSEVSIVVFTGVTLTILEYAYPTSMQMIPDDGDDKDDDDDDDGDDNDDDDVNNDDDDKDVNDDDNDDDDDGYLNILQRRVSHNLFFIRSQPKRRKYKYIPPMI
jgi:hypothetical protein